MVKEYLSEWFKAGLQEFGITEQEYRSMDDEEKNEVKETLAEFGHF